MSPLTISGEMLPKQSFICLSVASLERNKFKQICRKYSFLMGILDLLKFFMTNFYFFVSNFLYLFCLPCFYSIFFYILQYFTLLLNISSIFFFSISDICLYCFFAFDHFILFLRFIPSFYLLLFFFFYFNYFFQLFFSFK